MSQFTLLLVATLCAALPPDRDVSTPLPSPGPQGVSLVSLVPRPSGGFYALYRDDRAVGGGTRPTSFSGYRGTALSATLDPVSPTGVATPIPMSERFTRMVHDGTDLVAVWVEEASSGTSMSLYGSRFSESGVVRVPRTLLADCPLGIVEVAVAHDGARTVLTWAQPGPAGLTTMFAAALSTAGQLSGPWTLGTLGTRTLVSLTAASASGTTLVAWVGGGSPANTLQAVKISQGGAPGIAPPLLLHSSAELGVATAVGTTSGGWHFVLAGSPSAGTRAIRVAPLSSSATQLGTLVTVDSLSASNAVAHLAFTGTDLRVIWMSGQGSRGRVVPLSGAPTAPIQTLRSATVGVACNGSSCVVGWSALAPTGSPQPRAVYFSRLDANGALVDLPGKEIYFPADEQAPPVVLASGSDLAFVVNRTAGRAPPDILLRRLSPQGQWLGAPQVLASNQEVWASATSASGHVILAAKSKEYADTAAYSYVVAPGGAITSPVWPDYNVPPQELLLACAATRCGLLRGDSSYTGRVFDNAGLFVSSLAATIPVLNNADSLHFASAGSSFVVMMSTYLQPIRAAVATENAFPTFGSAFPLTTAPMSGYSFQSAARGNQIAVAWAEQNSCKVWGRLVDVSTSMALGTNAAQLHDCSTDRAYVRDVTANPAGGFTVLFEETGYRTVGARVRYSEVYRQELDSAFAPIGAAVVVDSSVLPLEGIALSFFGGRELYSYARWDETPGVLSWRAKVSGLDDAGVVDAGMLDAGALEDAGAPDASVPDAGVADAGSPDAGVVDAGSPDAGVVDAGSPDAGAADAGGVDGATPSAPPSDAGPSDQPAPVGCGCGSLTALAPWLWLLLLRRRECTI